jgi:protein-disulfide isomerase
MQNPGIVAAAVDADIRAARLIGATGTPAIVVNGWYLPGGSSVQRVDSLARAVGNFEKQ